MSAWPPVRAGHCRPLGRRLGPANISPGEGGTPSLDLYLTHTCGSKNYLHYKAIPRECGQRVEPAQTARQSLTVTGRAPTRADPPFGPGCELGPGPGRPWLTGQAAQRVPGCQAGHTCRCVSPTQAASI